jgi:FMN phosphatase YigB (HAD superfamily)
MKVVFDFDDVLFDAKRFKGIIFEKMTAWGVVAVEEKYKETRESRKPFSLQEFIRKGTVDTSEDNVEAVYKEILAEAKGLLNPRMVALMQALGRENCIILTNGDNEFQQAKILESGASELACEVVIVPGGKGESLRVICARHSEEEIVFVDDKLDFINEVTGEGFDNLKTVLFNTNGYSNLVAEINESLLHEGESPIVFTDEVEEQDVLAQEIAPISGKTVQDAPMPPFGLH